MIITCGRVGSISDDSDSVISLVACAAAKNSSLVILKRSACSHAEKKTPNEVFFSNSVSPGNHAEKKESPGNHSSMFSHQALHRLFISVIGVVHPSHLEYQYLNKQTNKQIDQQHVL